MFYKKQYCISKLKTCTINVTSDPIGTLSPEGGLQMILHTRPSTTFSKPLQKLINNGTIIHNKVPGF
jgi:hypothetical protein